jgi:hypothetical protein
MRARPRPLTEKHQARFLEALAAGMSVGMAAVVAGHLRRQFYRLRDRDPDFRTAWARARDQGHDVLLAEVERRGLVYDPRKRKVQARPTSVEEP